MMIMYGGWRKATYSNSQGACVELAEFRKTLHSNPSGNCVEAADYRTSSRCCKKDCIEVASGVAVRDTKDNGTGPILKFDAANWTRFISEIKNAV